MYEQILERMQMVRGCMVILDYDLADIFGLATKRLNEQAKRQSARFPGDCRFRLTSDEYDRVPRRTSSPGFHRGGRRHRPYAFTETGALMAAMIVKTDAAVDLSLAVIRDFFHYLDMADADRDLDGTLRGIERSLASDTGGLPGPYSVIRSLRCRA